MMENPNVMIERIQSAIRDKGVSVNRALVESGAGKDLIGHLKSGISPSVNRVCALADYLGVSVDYLLGRTDVPYRKPTLIRHIVLFRIKDEFKDEIPALVQAFLAMKGRIGGLLDVVAGADFLHSERSYDLALITVFRDRDAFDAYQTHPVHMAVKKRIHEVRSDSVACDFEFDMT